MTPSSRSVGTLKGIVMVVPFIVLYLVMSLFYTFVYLWYALDLLFLGVSR